MKRRPILFALLGVALILAAGLVYATNREAQDGSVASTNATPATLPVSSSAPTQTGPQIVTPPQDFLIENLQKREFPGGTITIERVVVDNAAFTKYAISYPSDSLKITGLMAVPKQPGQAGRYPAVILNHGYYPVPGYQQGDGTDREMDYLSSRGYLTVAPDYRNHAGSDRFADVYLTRPGYPIDVLNLLGSLKADPRVLADKIGIWGHSMGGEVTQKAVAVLPNDFKAVVLYGSMSATEIDNYNRIRMWNPAYPPEYDKRFGSPQSAPEVYTKMSPATYHADITAPFSIHHGTADPQVPYEWSVRLNQQLTAAGKQSEFFTYQNGPHIFQGQQWQEFMGRITGFYDRLLKG